MHTLEDSRVGWCAGKENERLRSDLSGPSTRDSSVIIDNMTRLCRESPPFEISTLDVCT